MVALALGAFIIVSVGVLSYFSIGPKDASRILQSEPPFRPTPLAVLRFTIAGPITCVIFIPALYAGIFGAPAMPFGMIAAWYCFKNGRDGYAEFAAAGFLVGVGAMIVASLFSIHYAPLFAFGLLFGPLMAMTFRAIAGNWRQGSIDEEVFA